MRLHLKIVSHIAYRIAYPLLAVTIVVRTEFLFDVVWMYKFQLVVGSCHIQIRRLIGSVESVCYAACVLCVCCLFITPYNYRLHFTLLDSMRYTVANQSRWQYVGCRHVCHFFFVHFSHQLLLLVLLAADFVDPTNVMKSNFVVVGALTHSRPWEQPNGMPPYILCNQNYVSRRWNALNSFFYHSPSIRP